MAGGLRGGELSVEHPEIGGAGVEVHHQRLPADFDGREEFRVAFLWCGLGTAGLVGGGAIGRIDDRCMHAFWYGPSVFAVCSRHLGNAIAGAHVPCLLTLDYKGSLFNRLWSSRGIEDSEREDEQRAQVKEWSHRARKSASELD